MKKILNEDVTTLNLHRNINTKLKNNNINTVVELCNYSRMELAEIQVSNSEINDIAIGLQLIGLDLKRNHAKRNKSLDKI